MPTSQADCTADYSFWTDADGNSYCYRCLDTMLEGPKRDFVIRMEAGQYLSARVDPSFTATLELIAPNASFDGVEQPSESDPAWTEYLNMLNHTAPAYKPDHWTESDEELELYEFNESKAREWALANTTRGHCYFSVAADIPSDGSPSTDGIDGLDPAAKHLIYEDFGYVPPRGSVCDGAHTMHYRVLIDPPPGGAVRLSVELDLLDPTHQWPSLLELKRMPVDDLFCPIGAHGVVECPWPYDGVDAFARSSLISVDLAGGAMEMKNS